MAELTESSTVIDASADAILDVIADLEAYPQWTKGLRSVRTLSEDQGWPDEAEFVLDAGMLKDEYVLRYTWDVAADSSGVISWELVRATVLSAMDGSYTLIPRASRTEVTYRLAVQMAMPIPGMLRRKAERSIVTAALQGLKSRVESGR